MFLNPGKLFFVICLFLLTNCNTLTLSDSSIASIENLYSQGESAYKKGDFKKAQHSWSRGLENTKQNPNMSEWSAHFLIGLARAVEGLGDYRKAIEYAKQAHNTSILLSNENLEAAVNATTGQILRLMGNYSDALHHSEIARKIANRTQNYELESDSIRNLGAIYNSWGNFELASSMYQLSLDLAIKKGNKWLQAKALNNLGEVSQRMGQYMVAETQYNQSLLINEDIMDLSGQGKVLGNICRLYQDLNNHRLAIEYCDRALGIARKISASGDEAHHLNNIAGSYYKLGYFNEAASNYHLSAKIKHKLPDYDGEARALNNIALIKKIEGNHEEAIRYFYKSLKIKESLKDRSGQSATYFNIGWTYSDLGQYDKALHSLKQALFIQTELGEVGLLWQIYSELSNTYNKLGMHRLAIFYGKLAVNNIQTLRSRIQKLDKYSQVRFMENKRNAYEQLANQLIDQERFNEAQHVLRMLKEEEFFDFVQRQSIEHSGLTLIPFSKREADYEENYRNITSKLIELSLAYTEIARKKDSGQELALQEEQRLDELDTHLKKVRIAYKDYYHKLEEVFTHANLKEEFDEKALNKINQYQDILTEGTVLIFYLYTDEKLRIMLIDSNLSSRPKLYISDITRFDLNRLIFKFRKKLSDLDNSVNQEAQLLFEILIEPMKVDLELISPHTLLIFPSRSLRYIPFSALYNGESYLIEQYAISIYTAAVGTKMLSDKPQKEWSIAAFGVSQSLDPQFNNLPAIEDEINAIVKEIPDIENQYTDTDGILPGRKYMNQAFTAHRLMETLKETGKYQVIHLATHFKLTAGSEKNSFMLAGDGSRISLYDFEVDDYQLIGKDLVTLSACETAVGDFKDLGHDGREIEGLGTLFQEKGANAVLATLWPVADQSTAIFMWQFYNLGKTLDLSKAESVRQSQLAFIRHDKNKLIIGNNRGVSLYPQNISTSQSYQHPYYWAPFILMGNWQ